MKMFHFEQLRQHLQIIFEKFADSNLNTVSDYYRIESKSCQRTIRKFNLQIYFCKYQLFLNLKAYSNSYHHLMDHVRHFANLIRRYSKMH